jgi:hypothetical protein
MAEETATVVLFRDRPSDDYKDIETHCSMHDPRLCRGLGQ